jgi:hypothetical protein
MTPEERETEFLLHKAIRHLPPEEFLPRILPRVAVAVLLKNRRWTTFRIARAARRVGADVYD